ncbi:MAG: HD domain-containing phosphohydrolase [Tepidisphaeraceae bacterium]
MPDRILIVDDERITAANHARIARSDGYEVVVAHSAEEARAALRADPAIRLVVADWQMPDEDGLSLCRWARSALSTSYIYFILVTARSGTESVIEGLAASVDEFLTKPVAPLELLLRIRAGLRVVALDSRDAIIFALAKLADSRDPETGQHLERVREYCRLFAGEARRKGAYGEIDVEFVSLIALTSPLHDIGKVGVPDAVLLKPGKLTPEETLVMRTHAALGAHTIDAVLQRTPGARFLVMARDIARSHHERWDGAGYPDGLSGDAIPLAARIMALADVYDALRSRRVYKPAMTHEEALTILRQGSGSHFDPALIDCLESVAHALCVLRDQITAGASPSENPS